LGNSERISLESDPKQAKNRGSARFFLWTRFSYGKNRFNTVGRGELREASKGPKRTPDGIQIGPGELMRFTPANSSTVKKKIAMGIQEIFFFHIPGCYS
jgi:hypothetical protein